ncbi:response regulator [Paenibacillus sp. CGMCC 1.16610]|nr:MULTISPECIES: helix-turn-helix domain-containing protein [Paenibacillus]MBA2938904.1 response regulator [Paenibacillus sp. CGMCC 1.16610]
MYQVMTIDDDVLMLQYLRGMINWEELNLQIVYETYSSIIALEQFRKLLPDIVITDIGLPQMDGLELTAQLRSIKPDVVIIFLTCHEEFNYAKQAFQLEALDYLIKVELTEEQLQASIQKAIRLLQTQKTHQEEQPYREDMRRNREILEVTFINRFMKEGPSKDLLEYGARLGVSWKHHDFIVGMIAPFYSSYSPRYMYRDSLASYGIYNIADELKGSFEGMTVFSTEYGVILVYNFKNSLHTHPMDTFRSYAMEVIDKGKEYLKIRLSLQYIQKKHELSGLASALHLLKERKWDGFYTSVVITEIQDGPKPWLSEPSTRLLSQMEVYASSFYEQLVEEQEELLSVLGLIAGETKLAPTLFIKLIQTTLRSIEMRKGGLGADSEAFYECLPYVLKVDDLLKLVSQYLQRLTDHEDLKDNAIQHDFKLKAINQYLQERLSVNVTTVDMAEYLHLNASYFSRYFKKVTGTTFTDFVHRHKIDNAIKMLERPEATIEGAASALGFSDRNYFSKIFKRYMGMTPGDYMQKRTKSR